MSFLDKVKDKVKGKSIEREVDEAFADNSYSRRVLDANARMQQGGPISPDRSNQALNSASQPFAPAAQAQRPLAPLAASRVAQEGRAYPRPLDEDEFMRRRYGTDEPVQISDTSPPDDLLEPHAFNEKRVGLPPLRPSLREHDIADPNLERVIENINIALKDLRAQNNHIIDLLRNIQDRLSR